MVFSSFTSWLRSRGDALVSRWAAAVQRRRMQRARAQLPSHAREKAAFWRARYLARNARLQREREARELRRGPRASPADGLPATQDISKADVLAAIARSRANRQARQKAAHGQQGERR
ncbi:MAG: hypothetical protein ACTHMO_09845 [Rhodanobacteraceae bacterium]